MWFLLRRLCFYLFTAWIAITINFLIPRLMPGNPVDVLFARVKGQISPGAVKAITLAFGLKPNESIFQNYVSYLGQLAHGNLGVSITYFPSTVTVVLRGALPWSIALVGIATVLSFILGTLLGVLSAWKRGSPWVDGLLPITAFLSAVPYFWMALIVLTVFGVEFAWLPVSGGSSLDATYGLNWAFVWSAFVHGILPAGTIVISSIAGWLLGMRNVMISTLSEDYVLLAEAKGLRQRRVIFTYAARNAILPNMASFALSLGFIVSGAILTEIVFSYPGIGYVLFEAVSNEDYPLMQGVFLIITAIVLIANFITDAVYVLLDPRTRDGG